MAGMAWETRRVIIIEELERAFLQAPGGLDAVRAFLDLIQSTGKQTLWIVAVNSEAARYLEAAAGLSRSFTYRINAVTAERAGFVRVILQRHYLSGLRLKFAAPPAGDPRLDRLRQWMGADTDPEALFFDSLYHQSGGVFRPAFELWMQSIERVEGGVIEMRQPLNPDYRGLREALDQRDLFALTALTRHGSLDAESLAGILGETAAASQVRLGRLAALGITGDDPDHPGIRILPEAQHFATSTLKSANLI